MKLIDKVIKDLEAELKLCREASTEEVLISNKVEVSVLGQMSLMMNQEFSSKILLAQTNDVDAILKGKSTETKVFRDVLKAHGLVFDELSAEIWIPEDAQFIEYYNSPFLKVNYLDPISALTSKAIKAKEKNKILVQNALKLYGDVLASKIKNNGGDITYFTISTPLKL